MTVFCTLYSLFPRQLTPGDPNPPLCLVTHCDQHKDQPGRIETKETKTRER